MCASTPLYARKPLNIRLGGAACAQVIGLTCESLGPCAYGRPDARSRRAASAGSVADGLELWGSDGSRALLLAVLTLQCAAKPHWWHGGHHRPRSTRWVNVRMKGPRPPPIGLTCAWMLACPGDMSRAAGPQPPASGASRLASLRTSRDTTEAGPRRVPPLVARGGRAVGAEKSAPETQRPSLSSAITAAVESGANAQFFHQPLTVSTAWVPRSDSAEWALTRPEDRRAAWKREATFSQFTRFHQALT